MSGLVLVLFVPGTLEDDVVDWLLARSEVRSFFSADIDAHGLDQRNMSIAEQVTGRQRMKRFEVDLHEDHVSHVVIGVRERFAKAALSYRVLVVGEQGVT